MYAGAIERYEVFKKYFSEEDAKLVTESIDESLFRWVASKEDVANVRTEVANLRTELKEDIANVRTEVANLRTELKEDIANVRTELKEDIAKMESSMTKWFVGTAVTMTGVFSGIVFALMKLVH